MKVTLTTMTTSRKLATLCLMTALLACFADLALAGQGCPFDDGSCQEYCNQQGCNMGYCGHFAWIQCICRKCGDEWSWYDKVRYNPDKTVNQTELDSLKLNGTSPLILTNSADANSTRTAPAAATTSQTGTGKANQQQQQKKQATLTTLLIPDLSDNPKLGDLNDIPDENSDKFLDYIAKNHEKLVQATSARDNKSGDQSDETTEEEPADDQSGQPLAAQDDETVEIQISSSNNNTSGETTTKPAAEQANQQQQQQQPDARPVTRLLKMAVVERASDEID